MDAKTRSEVSKLLVGVNAGDPVATERLWRAVHEEVREMAQALIARDGIRAVLQPTSMVSEACIRLLGGSNGSDWHNHRHFFAAVAETLRRIRVDRARLVKADKRGGGRKLLSLDDVHAAESTGQDGDELLALDEALPALAAEHPRAASVVQYRYFGGHAREEIAAMLDVSPRTVDSEWRFAKAWLYAKMAGEPNAAIDATRS